MFASSPSLASLARAARSARPRWPPATGLRCCGSVRATAFSRAPNGGLEFTFAPYFDVPELGFNRFQEFCMFTLQHPSFEETSAESRRQLYEQKREDRVKRAKKIFVEEDKLGTESLDREELKRAVERIGLPSHEASVAGILQRHSASTLDEGGVNLDEFLSVVNEAWGRVPDAEFHDKFAKIHEGVPGHEPIRGLRAYSWLGRNSPASYALKSIRNMWPYALRQVSILRNKEYNPDLDPELMERLMDTYEGGRVPGLHLAQDLATMAAAQAPTSKGGLAIRIVPTMSSRTRWQEGGEVTYVPLRGLPENPGPGGLNALKMWWKKLTV